MDGMYYEYYPRQPSIQWNVGSQPQCLYSGSIDDHPKELDKKIVLIKYFRANFLERMTARVITKEEVRKRINHHHHHYHSSDP